VGTVSVAGASNGLWSVLGGNKRLPMVLLNNSNVNLRLNTQIGSVVSLPSGAFKFSTDPNGKNLLPTAYDKVILAFPFTSQTHQLEFNNFVDRAQLDAALRSSSPGKYHRTVSTLVAAKAVREKYGYWLDIIACTPNFFTSISRVHPVVLNRSERVPVFKVFSPEPLTDSQLNEIFEEIHQIDISDWLAYPEYEGVPKSLPSFILSPNLYHLNGIEWASSAIEMSLISGRNAAIHISNQISSPASPKIDISRKTTGGKAEL
jgi:prenylcysteine oxidase/farnesylcysteine lyase